MSRGFILGIIGYIKTSVLTWVLGTRLVDMLWTWFAGKLGVHFNRPHIDIHTARDVFRKLKGSNCYTMSLSVVVHEMDMKLSSLQYIAIHILRRVGDNYIKLSTIWILIRAGVLHHSKVWHRVKFVKVFTRLAQYPSLERHCSLQKKNTLSPFKNKIFNHSWCHDLFPLSFTTISLIKGIHFVISWQFNGFAFFVVLTK